jgi:superfamily I DNA/RNA helicase
MRWMISEDKLGPDQREVINDLSKNWKNTWIKGHAGSGKSVLLIHLLRDYLTKNPKSKVCVVVFTRSLVDMLKVAIVELDLEKRFKTNIPVLTIYEFKGKNIASKYDVVFCDEVQDLPVSFLHLLKANSNQVIVAGDEAQSIYESVPDFNEAPATPSQIISSLDAQQKPLFYIYRLTKSMVTMLSRVFSSILSGKTNIEKIDVDIKFCKASKKANEIEFVWNEASKTNRLRSDESVAMLFPQIDMIIDYVNSVLKLKGAPKWEEVKNNFNKNDFGNLNDHLLRNKIPMMYIGQGYGSLESADRNNKIILMTYHSSKGLDFDHVFLPMLGENFYLPPKKAETLLFVALSRSKSNLMISYSGNLYQPMNKFVKDIKPFEIDNLRTVDTHGGIII